MTWPVVTLDDLQADEPRAITDGPFGSNLASRHYTDDGPRVVRLQNIGDGRFVDVKAHISDDHYESLRAHEVKAGDLLVASLGEVLPRACLAPASLGPAIVKADCIRVRLGDEVDPRWVLYALQRPDARRWADEHRHGVGRPRLGLKVIRQIPVPLPPLDEQQRIVDVLEDHLSRLDAADSYLKQARGHLHTLRMSRLAALEGPGVELAALGELTSGEPRAITDGPFGSKLASRHYTQGGPRVVRLENIGDGSFLDEATHIDVEHFETLRRHEVIADDLIVASLGTGRIRTCLAPPDLGPAIVKADCIRVRLGPDVDPRYVLHSLGRPQLKHWAENLRHGVGRPRLGMAGVKALPVPLPPLHAQKEIAAELDEADRVASRLREGLDRSLVRSSLLRRSLLTAAFAGRLTSGYPDRRTSPTRSQPKS